MSTVKELAGNLQRWHTSEQLAGSIGPRLLREGKFEDALEAFTAAITASKHATLSALDGRATAQEKLEDLDAALKSARRTIEFYPESPNGYLRIGKILRKKKESELALKIYQRGLKKCKPTASPQLYEMLQTQTQSLSCILCPAQAYDPIISFPLELLEMIFSQLSFRDLCVYLRVSKPWRDFLTSTPSFWLSIDLSSAKKPVKIKAYMSYLKYSQSKVRNLQLRSLPIQGTKILEETMLNNKAITSLHLLSGGELGASLIRATKRSQVLKTLHLGPSVSIRSETLADVLEACPNLADLQIDVLQCHSGERPKARLASRLKRLVLSIGLISIGMIMLDSMIIPSPELRLLEVRKLKASREISIGEFLRKATGLHAILLSGFDYNRWDRSFLLNLPRCIQKIELYRTSHLEYNDAQDLSEWQEEHGEKYFRDLIDLRLTSASPRVRSPDKLSQLISTILKGPQSAVSPEFTRLSVEAPLLSTGSLEALIAHLHPSHIKSLSIEDNQAFGDVHASLIAKSLESVRILGLRKTKVTGVGVKALVEHLPDLHQLNLDECSSVGTDAVEWARQMGIAVSFKFV